MFTGHRELDGDFSARKLKKEIEKMILRGVKIFYNGMAMGFDLIAAETVLALKKKYPEIRLIACIPCYEQEKYYSDRDKKRYAKAFASADERVFVSENYHRGCMLKRNRYMAERADVMLAYCKKEAGGTAYTVKYFRKLHPLNEIVFL